MEREKAARLLGKGLGAPRGGIAVRLAGGEGGGRDIDADHEVRKGLCLSHHTTSKQSSGTSCGAPA